MAQVGNLICTGTSRFLNKIYGACTDGSVVSQQDQNTKFLRQDGEWATPSYLQIGINANNAMAGNTTVTKVRVVGTDPTTLTAYYPVWATGTGNLDVNYNEGLKYTTLKGTTTTVGTGNLLLGNSTASGSNGNKRGLLGIYSEKNGYGAIIYTASATTSTTHTLPDATGIILNTGMAAVSFNDNKLVLGYNSDTGSSSAFIPISSTTIGYASTAGALTTDAGHMSQPVYFSSGVPTKCGGIVFNRNIEGNGSHLIQTCDRVIVFAFRGGSTSVPVVGMLDRYGGITYISRNDNLATLSIQTSGSGYDGFKVQNKLSVYIEMFYIGWDTSVTP